LLGEKLHFQGRKRHYHQKKQSKEERTSIFHHWPGRGGDPSKFGRGKMNLPLSGRNQFVILNPLYHPGEKKGRFPCYRRRYRPPILEREKKDSFSIVEKGE